MATMRIPRLAQAALVVAGVYAALRIVFDVLLAQPIPASLLGMYMFFVVAGVFMVFTSTDESTRELLAPLKALVEDPRRRRTRNAVFVVVPLAAAGLTWAQMQPGQEAPVELRSIHPAPPATVKMFGKTFDLLKLDNPYRRFERDDAKRFRGLVAEGQKIYVENCHFCHGDKLDGRGPYAEGLNPVPANFRDVGTIAQLQESFLFWRIATGGPGLPAEAAPWISSMPVWQEFLTEDEIWKVILFLYDQTGHRPRSWGENVDHSKH